MRWKDLGLTLKFTIGFGVVLCLLAFVGAWSFRGVVGIVDDDGETIEGNRLRRRDGAA